MVNRQSERNLPSGIFAYHLHKPRTNRFPRVYGKQPISLGMVSPYVIWFSFCYALPFFRFNFCIISSHFLRFILVSFLNFFLCLPVCLFVCSSVYSVFFFFLQFYRGVYVGKAASRSVFVPFQEGLSSFLVLFALSVHFIFKYSKSQTVLFVNKTKFPYL